MTDNAAIVGEALHVLAKRQSTSSVHNARAALAALSQELAEAKQERDEARRLEMVSIGEAQAANEGRMAAEAELTDANRASGTYSEIAASLLQRAEKAEAALAEAKRDYAILREGMERQKRGADDAAANCLAAEAALAEAKQRIAYLVAEAHGWQPRLAKAEEALREIHHLVQTRRTRILMDGTEMFAQPLLAQINSIARAALAGEDDYTVVTTYTASEQTPAAGEDA